MLEITSAPAFGRDKINLIQASSGCVCTTARGLTQPTEYAAGGLFMHDSTSRDLGQAETSESEYISLTIWSEVKKHFPNIAKGVLEEYKRRGGQIPYEPGYVYLMAANGSGFYKIGKSNNPDRRLLEISPKMPFSTDLIKVWRSNFMGMAERLLHNEFARFRANGEWFQLPDEYLYCLLLGCEPEYSLSIRNAYITTLNFGVGQEELKEFNEYLLGESNFVSFGFRRFGPRPYSVALLEDWFDQIREESEPAALQDSLINRLKKEWRENDWL